MTVAVRCKSELLIRNIIRHKSQDAGCRSRGLVGPGPAEVTVLSGEGLGGSCACFGWQTVVFCSWKGNQENTRAGMGDTEITV